MFHRTLRVSAFSSACSSAIPRAMTLAIALAVTGLILWFAPREGAKHDVRRVTFLDALIAGVVQGLAVIPGISRSGSTISGSARRTRFSACTRAV